MVQLLEFCSKKSICVPWDVDNHNMPRSAITCSILYKLSQNPPCKHNTWWCNWWPTHPPPKLGVWTAVRWLIYFTVRLTTQIFQLKRKTLFLNPLDTGLKCNGPAKKTKPFISILQSSNNKNNVVLFDLLLPSKL